MAEKIKTHTGVEEAATAGPLGSTGTGAFSGSTEEKIREAHNIITRILATSRVGGPVQAFEAAQPPQYRYSFYYPTAGSWPSVVSGSTWPWPPQERTASWTGPMSFLGPTLGIPNPFGFTGFR